MSTQLKFVVISLKCKSKPRCVVSLTTFSCLIAGANMVGDYMDETRRRVLSNQCSGRRMPQGSWRHSKGGSYILPLSGIQYGLIVVWWYGDHLYSKQFNFVIVIVWWEKNGHQSPTELNIQTKKIAYNPSESMCVSANI